jgi:hypothetical protein
MFGLPKGGDFTRPRNIGFLPRFVTSAGEQNQAVSAPGKIDTVAGANKALKKTFGRPFKPSFREPSGPKKITVGRVIITRPCLKCVSHNVIPETARANPEMLIAARLLKRLCL